MDARIKGDSYPQPWYEDVVGELLGRIGQVDDACVAEIVRLHEVHQPRADEVALARIRRLREDAARSFGRTGDMATLQTVMAGWKSRSASRGSRWRRGG